MRSRSNIRHSEVEEEETKEERHRCGAKGLALNHRVFFGWLWVHEDEFTSKAVGSSHIAEVGSHSHGFCNDIRMGFRKAR